MEFYVEGLQKYNNNFTKSSIHNALISGEIMESRALTFDKEKQLRFSLGEYEGYMPYEECADGVREGEIRDIALITRVGRSICFVVTEIDETSIPKRAILSRAIAQKRCKEEYLNSLSFGDIIPCRVTHI
ncbi:MAG: 30S ribosomal protein S1, partial [Oscillospiraceae bacterium]